jgi:hypothetical protein
MKKHSVISCVLLLALFPFVQSASTVPEKPDNERPSHALLLGLIRTINTAEADEYSTHGAYASWQTLQPKYLNGWLTRFYSQEPNVHFGNLPEILPGWNLRLNVHTDGRGYDLLLEDATDKTGYAALSDERGIIRECRYLQ